MGHLPSNKLMSSLLKMGWEGGGGGGGGGGVMLSNIKFNFNGLHLHRIWVMVHLQPTVRMGVVLHTTFIAYYHKL